MILRKNVSATLILILFILLTSSCRQERMLFYPDILSKEYTFPFNQTYQEYSIKVDKNTSLNGLLFTKEKSKGLIFYLHGNAGSNASWGSIADVYLKNNYDFFILDYRGYGKSEGAIKNEKQLYDDIQIVYDSLKLLYDENNIVIIGYSIGTGPATKLASDNDPKILILKAPYYNMTDLAHQYVKIIPSFLIKYKLRTDKYITQVKCPVVIFHGNHDEVIYVGSSHKLKERLKPGDKLIILEGQRHNGINENATYQFELQKILK